MFDPVKDDMFEINRAECLVDIGRFMIIEFLGTQMKFLSVISMVSPFLKMCFSETFSLNFELNCLLNSS